MLRTAKPKGGVAGSPALLSCATPGRQKAAQKSPSPKLWKKEGKDDHSKSQRAQKKEPGSKHDKKRRPRAPNCFYWPGPLARGNLCNPARGRNPSPERPAEWGTEKAIWLLFGALAVSEKKKSHRCPPPKGGIPMAERSRKHKNHKGFRLCRRGRLQTLRWFTLLDPAGGMKNHCWRRVRGGNSCH